MSWKCKECGLENSDEIKRCVGCNWSLFKSIVLRTEVNHKRFTISSKIGKSFYSKYFGNDIAQYIDRVQYELFFDPEKNLWFLIPCSYTKQNIILNNEICKYKDKFELKTGDEIFIGSKSSGTKIAKVVVEIED